jgi:hypothetical protein
LGDIFQKLNAPESRKIRPKGEISPNLVTLDFSYQETASEELLHGEVQMWPNSC